MQTIFCLFALLFFLIISVILRFYIILPRPPTLRRTTTLRHSKTCSLAIFLGSGGHTTEALALVSTLDFSRYTPRIYIISEGDSLSAQKASSLELSKGSSSANDYAFLTIPRARKVHQSLLTTLPTALWSFLKSIYLLAWTPFFRTSRPILAEVLLVNGPGTCFVLCLAMYFSRFFGLPSAQIIYVESFARVQSLSLSGKLMRPLADRFLVQWPQLETQGEYRGWLV